MNNQRLKILIVAREFSPYGGSECAVGWNIATRLALYHDVTVLFASGSQFKTDSYEISLREYFQDNPPINGLTLKKVALPLLTRGLSAINFVFRKLSPVGLPILYYAGYNYWQKDVFRIAKQLHKQEKFDIVHQLTQISFREPGYLWKLNIPFFWGPTGGTSTFPREFYRFLSFKSRVLDRIRSLSAWYQYNLAPRVVKANRIAKMIYTFSEADEKRFKARANGNVKIMLDVGTLTSNKFFPGNKTDANRIKGLWCGRLDEYKAPFILLHALANDPTIREGIIFQIIGAGPLEEAARNLAKELNLNNIEWKGSVSHEKVFEAMSHADFFVHTSIKEATSSVIPEAISMGLPVICHDAFGMSIAVNEDCGIKIPLQSPEASVNGFHSAMKMLVENRDLLDKLKNGARERSFEISWDNMAQTIAVDYMNVFITGRKNHPSSVHNEDTSDQ